MNFSIEYEQETDGRWLAEVPPLPGVLCYGRTADDAASKVEVLALRTMAERPEQGESRPDVVFAFHDREEIGPRIAKHTGITPNAH